MYVFTMYFYNMGVIQRRFSMAAMRAPYLDGERKKPHENVSKKNSSENYYWTVKKSIYYLNGERTRP